MGFNPFIDDFPVEREEGWIGSKTLISHLRSSVAVRTNSYIVGPEGSGKTSLLKTAFTMAFRKKIAREKAKLIYFADLSNKSDGNDLGEYLADRLMNSLGSLIGDKDILEEIQESIRSMVSTDGKTRFQNIIEKLHDEWGYFTVIVMDYFEMFTMSENVTQEHHECLRSLIESGHLQCIVATNYDLSKDSLPKDIKGSYFLQKFTNAIPVTLFTEENVREYLVSRQEDFEKLVPEVMSGKLYTLSGGVPKFVNLLARSIYDSAEVNGGAPNVGDAVKRARIQCELLMNGWCKLLTESQIKVLQLLADQCVSNTEYAYYDFSGSAYEETVASLLLRGLIKKYVYFDAHENPITRDFLVTFNSLLFQKYCREGKMAEAAKNNPLEEIERKRSRNQGGNTYIYQNTYEHVDKVYENGAVDESQNLEVSNMNVVQGITTKDFLQMLGRSSNEDLGILIGNRFQAMIQEKLNLQPVREAIEQSYDSELECIEVIDSAFQDAGNSITPDVQVDEDQEIIEVTPAELQTLDDRYNFARKRIHMDLPEQVLLAQSERCQFYLKMAVVVEEVLSLPGINFDDYSAQLILYGKAIEQSLRDNFYSLFHKHTDLRKYSINDGCDNPFARDTFEKTLYEKANFGKFPRLIEGKKAELKNLCENSKFITYFGQEPSDWNSWWGDLANDIDRARDIRNLTAHPGTLSPKKEDLEMMYHLAFIGDGKGGILQRELVGRDLEFWQLEHKIPSADRTALIGRNVEMQCTLVKSNGAIRGKLLESGYEVNVSARKMERYREQCQEGCVIDTTTRLLVKVLEYKTASDREFFAAEVVS